MMLTRFSSTSVFVAVTVWCAWTIQANRRHFLGTSGAFIQLHLFDHRAKMV